MTAVSIISILFVIATIGSIYFWPEVALAAQLLGALVFASALSAFGMESGAIYMLFVVSVAAGVRRWFQGAKHVAPCTALELILILLILYMGFSLAYTTAPEYGLNKVLRSLGMLLPTMWLARYFSMTPESTRRTLRVCGVYGIGVIGVLLLTLIVSERTFRFGAGGNPLVIGYATVTASALVCYLAIGTKSTAVRIVSVCGLMGGIIVVVATGSRGPVLALIVAIILTFLRGGRLMQSLGAAAALIIFAIGLTQFEDDRSVQRILGRTSDSISSNRARLMYLDKSYSLFNKNLISGAGTGAFAVYVRGRDEKHYPHNMFAETAAESGLIGITLLCMILWISHRRISRIRREYRLVAIVSTVQLLFWIGLTNSVLSFDFPAHRTLFAAIGMLAGSTTWRLGMRTPRKSAGFDATRGLNRPRSVLQNI